MPEISQLTADGVTYDIKDETARASLTNKILTISIGTLPQSGSFDYNNARITSDMVVLSYRFTRPTAARANITWTTYAGRLRLTLAGPFETEGTGIIITLGKTEY